MSPPRVPLTEGRHYGVNTSTGCWEWNGYVDRDGYGQHSGVGAHRFAYSTLVGPIPPGLQLDHLCRNRRCVNPDHLEPVTASENNRRRDEALGRGIYATHCVHGHEFTVANTRIHRDSDTKQRRICRECCRLTSAARVA